jgi:hypothetical protein
VKEVLCQVMPVRWCVQIERELGATDLFHSYLLVNFTDGFCTYRPI